VTSKNEGVPALHIKVPSARFTLLYSHGNAEDVSISIEYLEEVAQEVQADVFAYEYVGYGSSALNGDKPSEAGCYRAVEAAWRYLVLTLAIPAHQIIIFGRSLGSGPTLHLASQAFLILPPGVCNACTLCSNARLSCARHSPSECGGVVVQSGLESGARVAFNKCVSIACFPLDIFRNYRVVPKIKCQVAIMHGSLDEVVPIENGINLHKACKRPVEPLWLQGVGHNDMPQRESLAYIRHFLQQLQVQQPSSATAPCAPVIAVSRPHCPPT